jgi:hypothetical protein
LRNQVRAKAVLGRDLKVLQAKRRKLEHPTSTQAQEASEEQEVKDTSFNGTSPDKTPENPPQSVPSDTVAIEQEFQTMGNVSTIKEEPTPAYDEQSTLPQLQDEHLTGASSDAQLTGDVGGDGKPSERASQLAGPQIPTDGATAAIPTATSEAPEISSLPEPTADGMFGVNHGADGDLDFDFDFGGGEASNNQEADFNANNDDFDLANFGAEGAGNATDHLLHNLDDFGEGDAAQFAQLDGPNMAGNQAMAGGAGGDLIVGGDGELNLNIGNESAFDDWLDGMDMGDGLDGEGGGETMEHGEFDDAFFGLNT